MHAMRRLSQHRLHTRRFSHVPRPPVASPTSVQRRCTCMRREAGSVNTGAGVAVGGAPGGCAAKLVKVDLEPVVDLLVDGVVLVADLLTREAFLEGLGLGGRAVLVGTAHEDRVVPPRTAVARVDIGGEHAADDVAEVGNVVDVRQRGRDEHVSASRLRQPRGSRRRCGDGSLGHGSDLVPVRDLERLKCGGALGEVLDSLHRNVRDDQRRVIG